MTLMELKEQVIKNKQLQPLFIFTGDETVILNIYIDKICKLFNGTVQKADSVKAVYTQLNSRSLIKRAKTCYIVRDDKDFINQSESAWEEFTKGKIQKDNIVILVYQTLDRRSKFFKHNQNNIVIFDKLGKDILTKYTLKELPGMDKKYAEELVEICEHCYERILLECDKIRNLSKASNFTYSDAFKYAMENKFIWIPPEDAVFSFVDACLKRNVESCYYYLNECKRIGENSLIIISNLYTNFRALLQVKSVGYSKEICNITGLNIMQVKNVSDKVNNYTLDELLRALRLIHYCETSIKNGTIAEDIIIDYLLVNLL